MFDDQVYYEHLDTRKERMMKRYHKVLFERELPFKPKTERNRKAYTRKIKHRKDF